MSNEKSNKPALFVDNERYEWSADTITGEQLRDLASVPAGVLIYQKVPGHPDRPIDGGTVINLVERHSPEHFSTQASGSQAGR